MSEMKKFFYVVLAGISLLAAAGCQPEKSGDFAIYLTTGEIPSQQLAITGLYALPLQPQPLLTDQDILAYHPDSHHMDLTPEGYQKIQNLFSLQVKVSGTPFVVVVGSQRIYSGAFWSPLSSLSFDGVVIMQPLERPGHTIGFSLGYPSRTTFTGVDPRGDPRILEALRAAGKLN
jgi:hypothetical protein